MHFISFFYLFNSFSMKIYPIILSIVLILLIAGQAAAAPPADFPDVCQSPENIMPNCDFSAGLGGWTPFLESGAAHIEVQQGGGECHAPLCPAAHIVTEGNFTGGIYQQVSVTPGNSYYANIVWLAFGGAGAVLYSFESPDIIDIVSVAVGVSLATIFWFFRLYAGADALALISLSVILPTYNGFIIPLSTVVIATGISIIYGLVYNLVVNSKTFLNNKKIFEEFDEPIYRKFVAFFLIHKKSKNEKFVFPAERIVSKKRKFRFRYDPDDEFSKDEVYVSLAMPLTLFFLIGILGLVLAITFPGLSLGIGMYEK